MSSKKAIIVDDSKLACLMVRKIFSASFKDWELLEATNGDDALAKTAGLSIQLALVDFNMPGMNGVDLAKELRAKQPELAIYLVTANVQEPMRQRAESEGLGFIAKPISSEKISELINGRRL